MVRVAEDGQVALGRSEQSEDLLGRADFLHVLERVRAADDERIFTSLPVVGSVLLKSKYVGVMPMIV